MVMDMDILAESVPVSRAASPPVPVHTNGAIEEEADEKLPLKVEENKVSEAPKKMGNLMKELKQDVTQGAIEFNMDSFF